MPKAVTDAAPSNQWLALEPENAAAATPAAAEEPAAEPASPEPPQPAPPPVRASRAEWEAHAAAQGADPGETAEMTKAELITRYGTAAGPEEEEEGDGDA